MTREISRGTTLLALLAAASALSDPNAAAFLNRQAARTFAPPSPEDMARRERERQAEEEAERICRARSGAKRAAKLARRAAQGRTA